MAERDALAKWLSGLTYGPGVSEAEISQTTNLCRAAYAAGVAEGVAQERARCISFVEKFDRHVVINPLDLAILRSLASALRASEQAP